MPREMGSERQLSDTYEIYAIKYACHDRPARENFLGGDPHDVNMPLDYYVWAIVGESRTFCVDTGFDEASARRRSRTLITPPAEGLKAIGIEPDRVEDVIVTHMHYDHAGNHDLFPRATFHLQDSEMAYCTGRYMCHPPMRHPYDPDDVTAMVRRVFQGRVQFHEGTAELAPGITLHRVGGHSNGLQIVRVRTRRGWVVLASDATHFYANIEQLRPFPIMHSLGDVFEGYNTAKALATSPMHIIPGHDPEVLKRYPSPNEALKGWIVRLDAPPAA
jgi:glyoxylase-like metal-dependent hydrolase (beta-lactamase superfamily II)